MRRLLVISISLLFITACCKDEECQDPTNPNCINYDPCYSLEKPSAKFIMEEGNAFLAIDDIWFADSIMVGSLIRFRSALVSPEIKHKWYVGAETFEGPITPGRNLLDVTRPSTITISHVIEYPPDLSCFPNDIGRDSVAQSFRLVDSLNSELNTYGTYRGALNAGADTFEMKIQVVDINGELTDLENFHEQWFINFHNLGDTNKSSGSTRFMSAALYNNHGVFVDGMEGTITINSDKTFKMRYRSKSIGLLNGNRDWHTFEGQKID